MKRLITAIFFTLTVSALFAQAEEKTLFVGRVVSDTNTLKEEDYGYIGTGFHSILQSRNKIELRFITNPTFLYRSYTILTFNEKWEAKHFYYNADHDSLFSRDVSKKLNLDTLFSKLVSNNIFSLPDQDSLELEAVSYVVGKDEFIGTGMAICDGVCYIIEFKISDQYRRYTYCNPHSYAEFYTLNNELREFANMVDLFGELEAE